MKDNIIAPVVQLGGPLTDVGEMEVQIFPGALNNIIILLHSVL